MNIYLYYLIDENEKVRYVGITTNVKQRMSVHKREKPKHTFEIIEHFDNKQDAGLAEQNHIMRHNTFDNGWNNSIGGELLLSGENHPRYIDGIRWTKPKEYQKQYYQENKEKRKEYKKQHYQENKEKIIERVKQYRLENKERIKMARQQHYQKNKERQKEYQKQYYQKNKEKRDLQKQLQEIT